MVEYYIQGKQRNLPWDAIDLAEELVCGEHAMNDLEKMGLVNWS